MPDDDGTDGTLSDTNPQGQNALDKFCSLSEQSPITEALQSNFTS